MMTHLSIPQYLLESSFCLAIFYLFYFLFLKKETHFQFNRAYLLNSALFSLAIPIINIDFSKTTNLSAADQVLPLLSTVEALQIGFHQTIAQQSNVLHISVADVITWAYYAGFFVMTLKLASGLFKLFGLINRSPKMKDKDHTLLISNDVPASSFFSYIFWQDKHDKNDEVQKTIMDHEMVHVRQWHSLDVIIMELMVIVKWFNPLIYLFRNSLKQTHEFIADKYVTEKMIDKVSYASILMTNKARTDLPPATNHFYGHIRERIQMLSAKKSTWTSLFKYLTVLPITLILFSLFSFDLSDRLPDQVKNSFQSIENTMLATAGQNVLSLNMDEDVEKEKFYFSWSEVMNIVLNQKNETQHLNFNYKADHLNMLLSGQPEIIQDGKKLNVEIDTVEVLKDNKRFSIDLEDLSKEDFRNLLIDSLNQHDQIIISLKSYSDTDSLRVVLHLGIDGPFDSYGAPIPGSDWMHTLKHSSENLIWSQNSIEFNEFYNGEIGSKTLNYDRQITREDLYQMLDGKIKVQLEDLTFETLDEDYQIVLTLTRARDSKLATIEANLTSQNELPSIVQRVSNIQNFKYSVNEVSKKITIKEFYQRKEEFKNWTSKVSNGDNLRVAIFGPQDGSERYLFNLRIKDELQATSAPFEIELPDYNSEYFDYQIVMTKVGKSIVRVDANNAKNKSIVDAYGKSDSYEVVNIKGFQTKKRIYETNLPAGRLEVADIEDNDVKNLNQFHLNDHYSEDGQLVRMDWGRMISMPNVGNYSIKEWKRSSSEDLIIYEGISSLKMERFDILIVPENGKIIRIRTDKVNTSTIRKTFDMVESNSSIYIDNIIINDEGERKFYPYNFVFTVE